jgi:hypothetical protein
VQLTIVQCESDRPGGRTHPKNGKLGLVTSKCAKLTLGRTSPENDGLGPVTSECFELTWGRTSLEKGDLICCHNSIV